ncbi:MAG: hypothetical protein CM1200mP26_12920 [Acidimicrobiales bacterium]|nr:MAG: hypothetical protein CM1200mP26_12920 [Acidimicrobiales bacterium]
MNQSFNATFCVVPSRRLGPMDEPGTIALTGVSWDANGSWKRRATPTGVDSETAESKSGAALTPATNGSTSPSTSTSPTGGPAESDA